MDRFLLSRPPIPVQAHAAADGDLLELDVLWPASAAAASSPRGLGILAALPEDEAGKKKKRAGVARSAARPVPETAAAAAALGMARSAPVRIPSEPVTGARRGRWAQAGGGGGEEHAGEAMVPPHEIVARRAAAHSSVLEGAGRTLKGRDLRRVRNAVLRRTGFLD